MPSVYFLEEAKTQKRYLLAAAEVTIGRDEACEVLLDDNSISRRHAAMTFANGLWHIRDGGSLNGTAVEGKRIAAEQETLVPVDTQLRIGTLEFVLRFGDAAEIPPPAPASASDKPNRTSTLYDVERFVPQKRARAATAEATAIVPIIPRSNSDMLFHAQSALFPGQPVAGVVENLLRLLLAYVPAGRASVQLRGKSGDLQGERTLYRKEGESDDQPFLLSRAIADKVVSERKVVFIRDTVTDQEFNGRRSLTDFGISSAVAAPIFDSSDVLGIVYADVRGVPPLREDDLATVVLLAAMGGTALVAANLFADMLETQRTQQREIDRLRAIVTEKK